MSVEHSASLRKRREEEAGSPAGAAESSFWQTGRREVESVSELAAWHSYHGTNSPGAEETAANCGAARKEEEAAAGAMRSRLSVSATARVPACHQGHTDGSLLGGCGCITDLRAKVGLCSNPHFYSH